MELTRATLLAHGMEVLRAEPNAIHLAVRVRSHLMDGGVSIRFEAEPSVQFTVRAQASDFPGVTPEDMFDIVREAVAGSARTHGFSEHASQSREISDPGDHDHVLDHWFELTFSKPASGLDHLLDDVHWALNVPKCIEH